MELINLIVRSITMLRSRCRSSHFFGTLAILVLVISLLPRAASAQGTSGSFPSPITSEELDQYARMLGLSSAQRLALHSAHDEYRALFRSLREGEMAEFLDRQGRVQGGVPQREVVEALIDDLERIHGRIANLDRRLLDRMLPMLSEQQQAIMPRVRMARERRRYSPILTAASFGRPITDLSVLYLDLPASQPAAADTIIDGYERRLTSLMRDLHDAQLRQTLDLVNGLADRGYENLTQEELMQDPQRTQEILGVIQEIFMDLRGRTTALAQEIRELNTRTYRQLVPLLTQEARDQLQSAFHRSAYPELGSVVALLENDWYSAALDLESLTDDQRVFLESVAGEYRRRLDSLLQEGVEVSDAFWGTISPFDMNQTPVQKFQEDLADIQQRATTIREETESLVAENLPAEQLAAIRRQATQRLADARKDRQTTAPGNPFARAEATARRGLANDQFLPAAISSRDLTHFAHQLQLESDLTDIAGAIHEQYKQRIENLPVLDELRAARLAASAGSSTEGGSATARIAKVTELRRRAAQEILAEDRVFFDDLEALLGEESSDLLGHVRRIRERMVHRGSAGRQAMLGSDVSSEASVDVVELLLSLQPDAQLLAGLDDVIHAYDQAAGPAFEERFNVQLQWQQMIDEWAAEVAAASTEDVSSLLDVQNRFRQRMDAMSPRLRRADAAIVELNRSTLDALSESLPPGKATALDRAYQHAAFPTIYNDPASVETHIAAALELEDLSSTQREQIIDLAASYRPAYEQYTHAMIEQMDATPISAVGLDMERFREWQQHQQGLSKIKYDRNELNARAITRLRAILTVEQIEAIGGLPDPVGEEAFYLYR